MDQADVGSAFVDLSTALIPAAGTCRLESLLWVCYHQTHQSLLLFPAPPTEKCHIPFQPCKAKDSRIVFFPLYCFVSEAFIPLVQQDPQRI